MKKLLSLLMIAALLCLSGVFAAGADTPADGEEWYELSADGTVLTVRLPGNSKDGMDWYFEISDSAALELITQEVLEGESEGMAGSPTTYVGSFMSTASAESDVSLLLIYRTDDPSEASFAVRILELHVSADNVITVKSKLERNQSEDWIAYDYDNFILTITLPVPESGAQGWETCILNPEFMELITCDTENGYVASFLSNLEGAGYTELTIINGNVTYTVDLFASEAGDLFIQGVETFTVLQP